MLYNNILLLYKLLIIPYYAGLYNILQYTAQLATGEQAQHLRRRPRWAAPGVLAPSPARVHMTHAHAL